MTTLIAPPAGYDATKEAARVSAAVAYLLREHPNTIITHEHVEEVIGRPVKRSAVGIAVARLRSRERSFGWVVIGISGPGGGYVRPAPVAATNGRRCGRCKKRSLIGTCTVLKGRPVEPDETCWCWS